VYNFVFFSLVVVRTANGNYLSIQITMKTIKVFALASHTFVDKVSGVDYARIIQPMRYLNGYKDEDVKFKVRVYDHSKNESFDWRKVFKDYDIVYFNYTNNDIGYAIMGLMAQKFKKKLICDLDDDLFTILADNPAHAVFKTGAWGRTVVKAILNDVSHLTCTNRHLKHSLEFQLKESEGKVSILPNYIDLDLYKHRCKFKDRGYYKALYFGSSTHFSDLYSEPFFNAMDRVMKEYPNFKFMSVGAFVPKYREKWGVRYEQGFGHIDLLEWIKLMPKFMDDADFMVVPLINNTYNRSKSSIKFLEASSYKIPGVYQNIRPYQEMIESEVNGYLASTEEEWYKSITSLINDTKLRESMGKEAFKTTKEWQIQDHLQKYAAMFKRVLF